MKKLLSIILCGVMVLSFVACGKDKDKDDTKDTKAAVTQENGKSDKKDSSSNKKLKEFVDTCNKQLASQLDSYKSQGLDVKITERNGSLVYSFAYIKQFDKDQIPTLKDQLEAGTAKADSVYQNMLTQLKKEVPSSKSVIIEYLNADNTVIFSKEYK